jgi:NADH-quinone oxidoreductase subunit M
VLATIGMILAAVYVLRLYQRVMQGPVRGDALVGHAGGPGAATDPNTFPQRTRSGAHRLRMGDLGPREIAVLAPLVVLVLALGFYPKPVLDVITPSVGATMSSVGVADPGTSQGGN